MTLPLCPLAPALVLALGAPVQDPAPTDAHALFVKNCATCHGETGDGQGTTELDRPARSFKDGGFSYGNTPDALFRTISHGIPGTPMPAFDTSLTEAERRLLAEHVVSLGPPIEVVDPERTVVRVTERPAVVRGYLPPIAEGTQGHPRGLLLGRPEGITFEYRVDDVRLLGLRQGEFVERRDWTGRGGAALSPRGKVVQLVEGGKPLPMYRSAEGPLTARLGGTWITPSDAGLRYKLQHGDEVLADVFEIPRPEGTSVGAGYMRRLRVGARQELSLGMRLYAPIEPLPGGAFEAGGRTWWVTPRPDKLFDVVGASRPDGARIGVAERVLTLEATLTEGAVLDLELAVLTTHAWDAEVQQRFVEEVSR